jgi:hypothetical protein
MPKCDTKGFQDTVWAKYTAALENTLLLKPQYSFDPNTLKGLLALVLLMQPSELTKLHAEVED